MEDLDSAFLHHQQKKNTNGGISFTRLVFLFQFIPGYVSFKRSFHQYQSSLTEPVLTSRESLIDKCIESAVSQMQSVIELGRVIRDRKTLPVKVRSF